MRRFAISDIHGCDRTFEALLRRIDLRPTDKLFLLGDYIDRGPDSCGVIDRIRAMARKGYDLTCLLGNHEQMMLQSTTDLGWHRTWLINGGLETLDSFGVDGPSQIAPSYFDWLRSLPAYAETPGYILVHAGINFARADPLADTEGLLWIRNWYARLNRDWLGDRIIVHGHTPIPRTQVQEHARKMTKKRVMNIDAGCIFHRQKGMGHLCALDLDSREVYFQEMLDHDESPV